MATLTGGEFVGRQQEMGKLKGALEDALSGRGQLLEMGLGRYFWLYNHERLSGFGI
jgi:hypothetical protein